MSADPAPCDIVIRMARALAAASSPLDDSVASRLAAQFDLTDAHFSTVAIAKHLDAARAYARRNSISPVNVLFRGERIP